MGFRVGSNPISLLAQKRLQQINHKVEKESVSLATGDKIYRAAYDPTGLAISEKLKYQIRSYGASMKNANQSISMFQVGEAALASIQDMGNRMKELALQAATDTMSATDRQFVNLEMRNLAMESKRVLQKTEYNGRKLLDGSGKKYDIQVGIHNNPDHDRVSFSLSQVLKSANAMGISGYRIDTKTEAQRMIGKVDTFLHEISKGRAELGSMAGRMQSTIVGIQHANENTSAANSRIRDTDFAASTAKRLSQKLQQDSTTNWLNEANLSPNKAMRLIKDIG